MEIKQQFNLKQTQTLTMNPVMQEALRLLQMSTLDLMQYLSVQISENPLLEELDDIKELDEKKEEEEDEDKAGDEQDDFSEEWKDYFEDSSDSGYIPGEKTKKEKVFFEGAIEKLPSLSEHLEWQLRLSVRNDDEFEIGIALISEMDSDGYIKKTDEELAQAHDIPIDAVRNVRFLIRQFEPIGVGALDLRECLLIQLKYKGMEDSWAYRVVEHYLPKLEQNKLPYIAKKLGIQIGAVKKAREEIRKLEPCPGRLYDARETTYVTPDVLLEKVEEKFVITLNSNYLPNISISPRYRRMLQKKSVMGDTRKYILEKYKKAAWLIKTLTKSKNTLYKVTESIVKVQADFFNYGVRFLKPLTLREIAEDISMHESTVCRVTTEKYVQTPKGIFELKYFFSSAVNMEGGQTASSKSVKEIIKDIIEVENQKKPLSDQKITGMLLKRGYTLARRTVAKYRENLQILPASKRRKY